MSAPELPAEGFFPPLPVEPSLDPEGAPIPLDFAPQPDGLDEALALGNAAYAELRMAHSILIGALAVEEQARAAYVSARQAAFDTQRTSVIDPKTGVLKLAGSNETERELLERRACGAEAEALDAAVVSRKQAELSVEKAKTAVAWARFRLQVEGLRRAVSLTL